MNDKRDVIKATQVVIHTGIVWGATFPYPHAKFLESFGWQVYDSAGQRLEFEAYGMRKLTVEGKPVLEMRFRDRSWTPIPPTFPVTVELVSPMP
jgi:hypothetical protein